MDLMEMFDSDGDGKITKKEFIKTLKKLAHSHNYEPTEADIK